VEADRSVLLAGFDTGEIDVAILMGTAGPEAFAVSRYGANASSPRCPRRIRWRNVT
jgi:hypothetical protein